MKIDPDRIPIHVAIIMDGNGRWAKTRALPHIMGHRQGVKTVERIMRHAKKMGVKILTLYTFSTENWKRSTEEIDSLMRLLKEYMSKKAQKLNKEGVRINAIGDIPGQPL